MVQYTVTPGDPSYLGTPLTWGRLSPGDPSYLGTPHTWEPLIPGDPSYLGTSHTSQVMLIIVDVVVGLGGTFVCPSTCF